MHIFLGTYPTQIKIQPNVNYSHPSISPLLSYVMHKCTKIYKKMSGKGLYYKNLLSCLFPFSNFIVKQDRVIKSCDWLLAFIP